MWVFSAAMTESPPPTTETVVVGSRPTPFRDLYHRFLRMRWDAALLAIFAFILLTNVVFGACFTATGGVAHMREGSFRDAFFFSVQTLGTIGYGAMYPVSDAANLLVTLESTLGTVLTAVVTGIVFAKFSLSTGRLSFSRAMTIAPMNGVPTLLFRIGNERGNTIMDALVRVVLIRTEVTVEGEKFYRMVDVPLARERTPSLTRTWSATHPIDGSSPLVGYTPERFIAEEIEFLVTVVGTDDTSLQPVHARQRYDGVDVLWGMRPTDLLHDDGAGTFTVDLRKFHDVVATPATESFPYSNNVRVG